LVDAQAKAGRKFYHQYRQAEIHRLAIRRCVIIINADGIERCRRQFG
jgi:hypothetical protein